MGISIFRGAIALLAVAATSSSQQLPDSGLVLAGSSAFGPDGFRLGDGGVSTDRGEFAVTDYGRCTTPGGVRIECRREGVRLGFPSGRAVLCGSDGYLHLRDGSVSGPFGQGVELMLADGAKVRLDLSGSRRAPIESVSVQFGGKAVRLWLRKKARRDSVHTSQWVGERFLCLGAGDVLYRALALGPVVTLQRVLAPKDSKLPRQRLALQVPTLLKSLETLSGELHRREIVQKQELQTFLELAPRILRLQGPVPSRIGSDPLTFQLGRYYEIDFTSMQSSLRLRLRRSEQAPFVEWQLGYGTSVSAVEASRRVGQAVAVPAVAPEMALREQRNELIQALAVFKALRGR